MIPYELIGKTVVGFVSLMVGISLLLVAIAAFLFAWVRGWAFISNLMWRGYEPDGERPPVWKMRISGVTIALSRFQIQKIPAAYYEAEELADDDTTARQAMVRYLKEVFVHESD